MRRRLPLMAPSGGRPGPGAEVVMLVRQRYARNLYYGCGGAVRILDSRSPRHLIFQGVAVDRADPACYGFAVKSLIEGHSVLPDDRPVSQTASKRSTKTIFGD